MRTEQDITAELTAARAAYHAASDTETRPQLVEREGQIKALMAELSDALSDGAEPCPGCGAAPHGRLKTPEHMQRGAFVPAVYAVGCLTCPPLYAPFASAMSGAPLLRQKIEARAVGGTPALAVAAWNRQEFVTTVEVVPEAAPAETADARQP